MSLAAYNPHDRYRRRSARRYFSLFLMLSFMALAAISGFLFGQEYAARDTENVYKRMAELEGEYALLQETVMQLRAEAHTTQLRYKQLEQSYQSALPDGPVRALSGLVKTQIEAGMDPQRLAFAIRSGMPPKNCTDPESRRFVLSTPSYTGPDSQISIAEGSIVITGAGVSARNAEGQPEAWYDPGQAVSIRFRSLNGQEQSREGMLPLQHSLVAGAREYRFTIEEGARSFVKVTFDSCDYP